MQTELLIEILSNIAGKSAANIAELLIGKKNVNEFLIAKKLNLTINQTRNILYKLSNFGLVTFTRKKDKKKAWYTYFWTLDVNKSLFLLKDMLEKDLANLKKQLEIRQNKRFFICKACGIEVSEETALANNFACSECGEVYELNTDKKIVIELSQKIAKEEKNIAVVSEELSKIKGKEEKKAIRASKSPKKKTSKKTGKKTKKSPKKKKKK